MNIVNEAKDSGLQAAVVTALGIKVSPSPSPLVEKLSHLVEKRKGEEFPPPSLKDSIRSLLKKGGFKPTGRNKPASEYLAQAAREGRFPFINNLVDINNYLSLLSGLPISLIDLDVTGPDIILRTGKKDESFVFNASDQVINVEGLICICSKDGGPLGNPVKDSMEAKLKESSENVVGVIYASSLTDPVELRSYAEMFASLLKDYGQAETTSVALV
ncbi:MAG: phenylalanine--tRNA ligase beta subunit-related protein [Candidatus Xenobiia bacterium LiM19]